MKAMFVLLCEVGGAAVHGVCTRMLSRVRCDTVSRRSLANRCIHSPTTSGVAPAVSRHGCSATGIYPPAMPWARHASLSSATLSCSSKDHSRGEHSERTNGAKGTRGSSTLLHSAHDFPVCHWGAPLYASSPQRATATLAPSFFRQYCGHGDGGRVTETVWDRLRVHHQNPLTTTTWPNAWALMRPAPAPHAVAPRRGLASSSSSQRQRRDAYEVLGVDRSATDREIKVAYLKAAREFHPDVNDTPEATERFQEISEAYEAISTSAKRARYAFDARTGSSTRSGGGAYDDDDVAPSAPHVDPEELFRTVAEDLGVGGEIVKNYLYDLQDDMADVSAAVKEGRYGPLVDFVKRRKGLFVATLLPLLVVLRMPGLALSALSLIPRIGLTLISALSRMPPKFNLTLINVLVLKYLDAGKYMRKYAEEQKSRRGERTRGMRDDDDNDGGGGGGGGGERINDDVNASKPSASDTRDTGSTERSKEPDRERPDVQRPGRAKPAPSKRR